VVAIGENATAATENAIDGTGEPRAYRHHAASECLTVLCLDDEVRVIPLERVVHEAESLAGAAFGEGALDLADDANHAQRRQAADDTYGHVRRARAAKVCARPVLHAGIRTWLAAGVATMAAPAAWSGQRECELTIMAPHLIGATLSRPFDVPQMLLNPSGRTFADPFTSPMVEGS
jgi:hypothetical protein